MKKNSFWELDKVWHCGGHILIALILSLLFNITIGIILSEIVGVGTEIAQKVKYGDKISKKDMIGDLIWNNLGMIVGSLAYLGMLHKFILK